MNLSKYSECLLVLIPFFPEEIEDSRDNRQKTGIDTMAENNPKTTPKNKIDVDFEQCVLASLHPEAMDEINILGQEAITAALEYAAEVSRKNRRNENWRCV
jgi:hypothetical protein